MVAVRPLSVIAMTRISISMWIVAGVVRLASNRIRLLSGATIHIGVMIRRVPVVQRAMMTVRVRVGTVVVPIVRGIIALQGVMIGVAVVRTVESITQVHAVAVRTVA